MLRRKVRTAQSIAPVKSRVPIHRKQIVPQKITSPPTPSPQNGEGEKGK